MTQAPTAHLEIPADPAAPDAAARAAADAARAADAAAVEVQAAELPEAADTGARAPAGQLDILLDTAVDVIAYLGEARLPAREVLQLGPGAVLRLDRQAGQPIDLVLNGVRFATGHLVVVGDRLGVRIKEVLAPPTDPPAG